MPAFEGALGCASTLPVKTEAKQGFSTAFLEGDFDAVARHLDDLARANAAAPVPGEPVTPVLAWLVLLDETGDSRRASAIAKDFLRRLPSYDDPSRREETLFAVQALVATGEMAPMEATARARSVLDAVAPAVGVSLALSRAGMAAGYAQVTDDEATLREIIAAYAEPLPSLDLAASL